MDNERSQLSVSVAIASYNGEKYIEEQIMSILAQLDEDDELIISDDGSKDSTIAIVERIRQFDQRVKRIEGPKKGIFKNFENALLNCSNDIIFLSDQDDIWIGSKINTVLSAFDKSTSIVLHRAYRMYDNQVTDQIMVNYKKGLVKNLLKSSYWGCCMAVRRSYINKYLPYGIAGIAHDQLVGLLGESDKVVRYIEQPLIYHRYHENNQTRRRPIIERIAFRVRLLGDYIYVKYTHRGDGQC